MVTRRDSSPGTPPSDETTTTRTAKIVATLGPATDSEDSIRALVEAGVNVFRLNASHGSAEEHVRRIARVRSITEELGTEAAVMLDLQGPKIRLGTFAGGVVELVDGSSFTITTETVEGNAEHCSISYPQFADEVEPDDRVLVADGTVELRVVSASGKDVLCRVVQGGIVGDRKGVNLPGVHVKTPALTKKDMADLRFGIEAGIDLVALSFVRKRDDVLRLRLFLEENDAQLPIIAKIEKPEAWENIGQILEESDGVMVARGDLGVEVALEQVPHIQKAIIEKAREAGKFVITATQMLESMVESPTPTRAEVSDVANAIYDGTDAVMLSAETSTGRHPIAAARMMVKVTEEAERSGLRRGYRELALSSNPTSTDVVADAAYHAAQVADPAAIVVLTGSGYTARLMAKYRPPVPIYAFTTSLAVARQLQIIYGVWPIVVPKLDSTDEVFREIDELLLGQGRLKLRDRVIVLAGLPAGRMGPANVMKLHRIGEMR